MAAPQKAEARIIARFSNPASGHLTRRTERRSRRDTCMPMLTAAKKWKQPMGATEGWANKNVVHPGDGVIFSLKKEGDSDTSCSTGHP